MFILGPCSAENREQVLLTARQIKDACGDTPFVFRAGAWKPRTSPASFQGLGEQALEWIAEVKRELHIPVATEVATPEHVQAAVAAGIDYLWIGARTSANPLAVQAIADTLTGIKAVIIKNPVNADADLWLGNMERLAKTGIPVIAVHRGCNHQPCWAMAHQVRTARPDIPLLLDPSHMSGDAKQIPALLEKMIELGLDGAMIEVHCNPSQALSDAKQQIPTRDLRGLIEGLRHVEGTFIESATPPTGTTLTWLRAEIDELDNRLWETIAARMDVSQRIGEWKKEHDVAPLQPERFQQVVAQVSAFAKQHELSEEFTLQVLELIHKESLRKQE